VQNLVPILRPCLSSLNGPVSPELIPSLGSESHEAEAEQLINCRERMLEAKSISWVHLFIRFRQVIVKSIGIIRLDPKEYHSFPRYDAAILGTTFEHIRICLCCCRRYELVGVIVELLVWIGGNGRPIDNFFWDNHRPKSGSENLFREFVRSFVLDDKQQIHLIVLVLVYADLIGMDRFGVSVRIYRGS